jgi:hypothetical protein
MFSDKNIGRALFGYTRNLDLLVCSDLIVPILQEKTVYDI